MWRERNHCVGRAQSCIPGPCHGRQGQITAGRVTGDEECLGRFVPVGAVLQDPAVGIPAVFDPRQPWVLRHQAVVDGEHGGIRKARQPGSDLSM